METNHRINWIIKWSGQKKNRRKKNISNFTQPDSLTHFFIITCKLMTFIILLHKVGQTWRHCGLITYMLNDKACAVYQKHSCFTPLKSESVFSTFRCLPLTGWVQVFQWAYLITVGVISAQKKMLKLLTAWDENMPMMEKATEKFLFSVPELSADKTGDTHMAICT